MKYAVQRTSQFKRDYRLAVKRGCNVERLREAIAVLANGDTLAEEFQDHSLGGNYAGYREFVGEKLCRQ